MRVHEHVVQFYEKEASLCESVAPFLAEGLSAGQPAILIATAAHTDAIRQRLTAAGYDVDTLKRATLLTTLDARDTLEAFMVDGMPEPGLFRTLIAPQFERALRRTGASSARAYGEMVDVLVQDGRTAAAIRLEQLWNELAQAHSFSLLCAYALDRFNGADHAIAFDEVCRAHSVVRPTERFLDLDSGPNTLREIARLQQRARALAAEVAYREELERALRGALAECQRVEAEREALLAGERSARTEAEAANRLKDEFLALVSHELRTPLNAIVGWAHILSSQPTDETTRDRAVDAILRNADVQQHVVADLLDVSRMMMGKMEIGSRSIDLVATAKAAIDSIRPIAASNGVELEVAVDDVEGSVVGDAARLQQVVWNLISNSIKFTPEGGRILVHITRAGSCAEIVVSDTGQGVDPSFLPHMFDRFRQADTSSTRNHGGLGLGLSLVRHLVEAHGGTVTAHSDGIGRGTTVAVRLPFREVSSSAA